MITIYIHDEHKGTASNLLEAACKIIDLLTVGNGLPYIAGASREGFVAFRPETSPSCGTNRLIAIHPAAACYRAFLIMGGGTLLDYCIEVYET
jgi:hypothetical protein